MDFTNLLPPELTEKIFSYLSIDDLEYCVGVSQLWKRFINDSRQGRRLVLKNNWECGIYKQHSLALFTHASLQDLIFVDRIRYFLSVEVYPAEDPIDCFYYPLIMRKSTEDNFGFYMICIDANLKISSELLFIITNIHNYSSSACVMRDYVVWFHEDEVQTFDAKWELDNRVKTIGTIKTSENISDSSRNPDLNSDRDKYERFLALDSSHIVAATRETLKVWCKQTHELILERNAPPKYYHICSFRDGCLVISTRSSTSDTSQIEIYNMRSKAESILQHEMVLDGKVKELKSNKNSIVYTYEDPARHIVVLDKKTYAVKFSHPLDNNLLLHEIFDELIIFKSIAYPFKPYVLNFITREFYRSNEDDMKFFTVFSNLAVGFYDKLYLYYGDERESEIDVWDWKRNVKLFSLTGYEPNESLRIVSVSELMVVCIATEIERFIIYKFE